jgi:hypothetical protein
MLKNNPANYEFWYFLINGIKDNTGAYGNFYAYGSHCGDALNNAYLAMNQQGFSHLNVYETLRLDTLEDWNIPEDAIKIAENVYMRPDFHYFKIDTDETTFNYPDGIVASTYEGDYDFEVIEEGFSADEKVMKTTFMKLTLL